MTNEQTSIPERGDYGQLVLSKASKSKYEFDTLKMHEGFKIPEETSVQTMRVTVSKWHAENKTGGKRFKVFANERVVVRVK